MKQRLLLKIVFLLFFCAGTVAQTKIIQGTVTDADGGLPLPGVSIRIKGSQTGTMSGTDGRYVIEAGNGAVLEYTYIGYVTRSIPVGNESLINLTLSTDN